MPKSLLVFFAAAAVAMAVESKSEIESPKPDRVVKGHLEPHQGHKVHGYYPRSEWSYFHPSWSLPSFPSMPSFFKDEEDEVLLKRIDSLEKSQKEILDLLKKVTDGEETNARDPGTAKPVTNSLRDQPARSETRGSNVLRVLVRPENKITNTGVPDNTAPGTNSAENYSAFKKLTNNNGFRAIDQGAREGMQTEMRSALSYNNLSGLTNTEEAFARNNPDDDDIKFNNESSDSSPNVNINIPHPSTHGKLYRNSGTGDAEGGLNYNDSEGDKFITGASEIMVAQASSVTNQTDAFSGASVITVTQVSNVTNHTETFPVPPEITVIQVSNVTDQTEIFSDPLEITVTQVSNVTNQTETFHEPSEITAAQVSNVSNQTFLGASEIMVTQISNVSNQTETFHDPSEIIVTQVSSVTNQTEIFPDPSEITVTQSSNATEQIESLLSGDEVAGLLYNTSNHITFLPEEDKTDPNSSKDDEEGQEPSHCTKDNINGLLCTNDDKVSANASGNPKESSSKNPAAYANSENSADDAAGILGSDNADLVDLNKALGNFPAVEPQLDAANAQEHEGTVVHNEAPGLSVGDISVSGEIFTSTDCHPSDEPSARPEADCVEAPVQAEGLAEGSTAGNDPSVDGSRLESPADDVAGKHFFGNGGILSSQDYLTGLRDRLVKMHRRKAAIAKDYGAIHRVIHADRKDPETSFENQDILFAKIDEMVQRAKLELSKDTVVPKPGPPAIISLILKPILSDPLVATTNQVLNLGLKNRVPETASKKPEGEPCKVVPAANDAVMGSEEKPEENSGMKNDEGVAGGGNESEASSQGNGDKVAEERNDQTAVDDDGNKEQTRAQPL